MGTLDNNIDKYRCLLCFKQKEKSTFEMLSSFVVFCMFLILWPFVFTVEINEINRPTVGVIRWDAWNTINGQYDVISNRSHMWFNPERYHYRLCSGLFQHMTY